MLRRRNFSLLVGANLISSTGNMVLYVALPFYVYLLTGSALATGTMFVAETIPPLLLGPLAGVFVDRWDRRRTMIVADTARAVLLLPLLFVAAADQLWLVYVVGFGNACLDQFFSPAQGALLPRLVGPADLAAANSLNASAGQVPLLIGPAFGGVLLDWLGLPAVVLADSISFLISALMIAAIVVPPGESAALPVASTSLRTRGHAIMNDLLVGLRIIRANRIVAGLFATVGVLMVSQGIKSVATVPFVTVMMHGDASVRGLMVTAQGVGGILGGLVLAQFGRLLTPLQRVIWGPPLVGLLLLVMVNWPALIVVLLMMLLIGIGIIAFFPSMRMLLQTAVDDRYRGRVLGAFGSVIALSNLLGLLLASTCGDLLGPQLMMNLSAALYLLAGAVALCILRRLPRSATSVVLASNPGPAPEQH
ncbi:MAG TPA: MFS transporter [Chloroflexia bacterium]|nr:MFS transporter [Chloroflexia bacterium]